MRSSLVHDTYYFVIGIWRKAVKLVQTYRIMLLLTIQYFHHSCFLHAKCKEKRASYKIFQWKWQPSQIKQVRQKRSFERDLGVSDFHLRGPVISGSCLLWRVQTQHLSTLFCQIHWEVLKTKRKATELFFLFFTNTIFSNRSCLNLFPGKKTFFTILRQRLFKLRWNLKRQIQEGEKGLPQISNT